MILQKKYYKNFANWNSDVLVLPPIFKRLGLNIFLYFPVAKRLSNNSISRPVGVISISKNKQEKIYNLENYEFSYDNQDFAKSYPYKIENQENIKFYLNHLATIFSVFTKKQKAEIYQKYLDNIKQLFPQEYWEFYQDLKANQILPVSDYILKIRKKSNTSNVKNDYQNIIKKEISKFVKKEILSSIKDFPSIAKIQFFNQLGVYLRSITFSFDKDKEIETHKFQITKICAKILNKTTNSALQEDFLSKVLLMTLNALLLEQKKKKKLPNLEQDLQNYFEIFSEEIGGIENEQSSQFLQQIFNDLKSDHNIKSNQKFSDIFFAYLYIFL